MKMDHVARAKKRIINQYRGKQRMTRWLTLTPTIANEKIEQPISQIYSAYDVDTVTGEDLDVIGRIVGVPRPILRGAAYDSSATPGTTTTPTTTSRPTSVTALRWMRR